MAELVTKQASSSSQDQLLKSETRGDEYLIRKNPYLKIFYSKTKDELSGGYKINFNSPLPQFDTVFGKAYTATRQYDNGQELYAIALEKKHPIRLIEINKLIGRHIPNFVSIIAAEIIPTSISKGRNFVVIVEKPKGISLLEHITKTGPLNENLLAANILPIINDVIAQLSQMGIVHGRINAGNIYIDDSGHITIGECISEPCGYSQPMIYETLSRACTNPIAKGASNKTTDYYALGVLVAILLRGRNPTEGLNNEDILNLKFETGTYNAVIHNLEVPARLLDLLRGLLNERKVDSWNNSQVSEWIKGRRFNLLPPTDGAEGKAIIFYGKKYLTPKHLAHGLHLHWEEGRNFVKTDAVTKWVHKNSIDDALVEKLEIAAVRISRDKDALLKRDDELLAQYILLLDPSGPVRLHNFSSSIDGIGSILADGIATNSRQIMESVEGIISHNLLSIISNDEHIGMNSVLHETLFTLQKCAEFLRKKDFGFDIERCLYELNPSLPCQSPLVVDEVIYSMEELLLSLDRNESIGGKILDKHMAAFLSERMELTLKIFISSLSRFPEVANNIYIQILALLSLAQQTSNVGDLPKLSAKVHEGLKYVVNELHSKTIRENIAEKLYKATQKGNLANILRIVSESRYLLQDRLGFKKYSAIYRNNAVKIIKYSNSRIVNNIGYRYGLQLAVIISFFVASIEVILLLVKAF